MSRRIILDLSGEALDEAAARVAPGGERACAFGRALDRVPVAGFALGFADGGPASGAKDSTLLASFLLSHSRRSRFLVRGLPARQHPINVARALSTLSAIHRGRIGLGAWADDSTDAWFAGGAAPVAARAADYLRLVSSLWDTWPLDALARDTQAPHFVDDQRLVRVTDPVYTAIGGPLTLPTDLAAKPPLLLVHRTSGASQDEAGIDLQLQQATGSLFTDDDHGVALTLGESLDDILSRVSRQAPDDMAVDDSMRRALGLGASAKVARQDEPIFRDASRASQV